MNGRNGAGSLSNSMPVPVRSISASLKRKYGRYRVKNVPFDIASVMLSPEILAMVAMVCRLSITMKRHGWLFS